MGSLAQELLTSGAGVGLATLCTNPIDVVKVRMQLQPTSAGLVSTASSMWRQEGVASFTKGLTPAVCRAVLYGGLRLGLYGPIRDAMHVEHSFLGKLAAGVISGAGAAAASNPLDLVKTRLQVMAKTSPTSPPLVSPTPSRSIISLLRAIVQKEGIGALWKGTGAGATRAAVLTASQCATYDEAKRAWLRLFPNTRDGIATHVGVSMLTGLVTTTATAPVDVVKTHMYVQGARYTGPLQCAAAIVRKGGVGAMFKGWTANYARLGPQTMITFVAVEQLRMWLGMQSI